jgi:uncharacterized membrane protein
MNRLLIPGVLIIEAICLFFAVVNFSYYTKEVSFHEYQVRQKVLDSIDQGGSALKDRQGRFYDRMNESE